MKKIWLLTTLLIGSLLLTGCNKLNSEIDEIRTLELAKTQEWRIELCNNKILAEVDSWATNFVWEEVIYSEWDEDSRHSDNFIYFSWSNWENKVYGCGLGRYWKFINLYPVDQDFLNSEKYKELEELRDMLTVKDEEPVTEEAKPIEVLWVTEYYLDMNYQIKSWDNYIMEEYKKEPTNDPIYLNSFDGKYDFIWKMYWNVLLTWYLENRMVAEWYFYETQEEMDNAPKVENWYIKYYPNWDDNPKSLNLWYMRENIFPARESFNKWDWDAIIVVWSRFFSARIDSISHFPWDELPWEMYGNNLHHFVNDWKIHTFRVEIFQPPFEWEWWYAESFIKDWEILD